jgi:hypothetical protein
MRENRIFFILRAAPCLLGSAAAQMDIFNLAQVGCLPETKNSILWLVPVTLAALLRLGPIAFGLPYIDYVDEGYALHQAIDLLKKRTLDTGWYGYPSLPAYMSPPQRLSPTELIVAGRFVAAFEHRHCQSGGNYCEPD